MAFDSQIVACSFFPADAVGYIDRAPLREVTYAIYNLAGEFVSWLPDQFGNWYLTVDACRKNPPIGFRCDDAGFIYPIDSGLLGVEK